MAHIHFHSGKAAGPEAVAGRTNRPLFAAVLGCAAAGSTVLLSAAAAGVVPVSFAVSGTAFKVSADDVRLKEVTLLPGSADGSAEAMAREGTASGICQSALVPIPGGHLTVRLTAARNTPGRVTSVVVAAEQLEAADAEAVDVTLSGPGELSYSAPELRMRRLRMTARSFGAGTFGLAHLRLSVESGRHECF